MMYKTHKIIVCLVCIIKERVRSGQNFVLLGLEIYIYIQMKVANDTKFCIDWIRNTVIIKSNLHRVCWEERQARPTTLL